ncbi:signal peptidase II [Parelusimicrobium proximum]|uniref:signal peptidase II n=1 Tax=Parelusimicrobium proximum TaxID=3228953 RepID=UPI003D185A86
MKNNKKTILIIFLLFVLDRFSKELALRTIAVSGPAEIFKYFHLTYVENSGVAFGIGQNGNAVFIVIMIVILAFLFKSWRELSAIYRPWGYTGMCMIIAGAFGNLYDRVMYGFVIDYFDFKVWPVFNVADSYVCVGAALLMLGILLEKKDKKEPEAAEK